MYEIIELKKVKDRIDKVVYEYNLSGNEWSFLKLKKGCIVGEHYHKGTSKLRNPENLLLIEGKFEFFFKDLHTSKSEKVIIDAPKLVKIKPFVYHEAKILEDSLLIEPFDERSAKDRFEIKI